MAALDHGLMKKKNEQQKKNEKRKKNDLQESKNEGNLKNVLSCSNFFFAFDNA